MIGFLGTYLVSLDGSFDGFDYGNLERLFIGGSLGSTYVKAPGSDEGIKLGSTDSKVLGTILGNVDEITLGLDI